jgi:hypothetical protein
MMMRVEDGLGGGMELDRADERNQTMMGRDERDERDAS